MREINCVTQLRNYFTVRSDSDVRIRPLYLDERKGVVRNYNRYANGEDLVDTPMKAVLEMAKVERNGHGVVLAGVFHER